jgi:hypothetical protein
MRCVNCNRILTIFEERLTKPDGTPEDLCTLCRQVPDDGIGLASTPDIYYAFDDLSDECD